MANGYLSDSTQRMLSIAYQYDRFKMIFIVFCLFVHCTKVPSAAEGLRPYLQVCGVSWPPAVPVIAAAPGPPELPL